MATATIPAVAVKVDTDLGTAPDSGPSVVTVSAATSAAVGVYHRINPYFYRLSDKTEAVLVEFECEHTAQNSVVYAKVNGLPQSQSWIGSAKVDTTRTRRTVGAVDHRPLTVTSAPSATVQRTIVCAFEVVKRYNSRTQEWEALPRAPKAPPQCQVTFDLTP